MGLNFNWVCLTAVRRGDSPQGDNGHGTDTSYKTLG